MKKKLIVVLLVCYNVANALKLPGPLVYVVTPSPRPLQIDEGRAAPYYHQTWMKRMDSPANLTTTTTPKVKTPDLIFAEFESEKGNNGKSIRKLLEQETIQQKRSTTARPMKPIYVPDVNPHQLPNEPLPELENKDKYEEDLKKYQNDMTNYFDMYNSIYNNPGPIFLPSTTTTPTTTTTTTTTTTAAPMMVENIWHIIDNEKQNQYGSKWQEVPIDNEESEVQEEPSPNDVKEQEDFAMSGFGAQPGIGAENESRAIRTEPNLQFPYVNLKPFQVKNMNKHMMNSKKGNNMLTSLDNFYDVKNPVRGEAQDFMPQRQAIDRYNPAQPYLPQTEYGTKSKQSYSEPSPPVKSVANLVPPPPPAPPKVTANDFPAPPTYDSFPPYAPSSPDSAPPSPPSPPSMSSKPITKYQIPMDTNPDDSGPAPSDGDDNPSIDLGYRYKPPSAPIQPFVPTLPPLSKPFKGYSYDKPKMPMDSSQDDMTFQGYQYNKPIPKPHEDPSPDFHHHEPPSYGHDHDEYPELIFNKPHGDNGDDMKANDMGMIPPPAPADMKPDLSGVMMNDHGFPQDFPGDFKFHHDFDDHDFYHHHHHHPTTTTTTTTTTETPRVNRYSYYYLGKKLYYLPLYFSVYFIVYVGALIIKAVLRHKIVYPNSWRPNDQTASFFAKRSIDSWDLSNENLHEITGKVTHAIGQAAEKYYNKKKNI